MTPPRPWKPEHIRSLVARTMLAAANSGQLVDGRLIDKTPRQWDLVKDIDKLFEGSADAKKSHRYTVIRWLFDGGTGSTKALTIAHETGLRAWLDGNEHCTQEAQLILREAGLDAGQMGLADWNADPLADWSTDNA